MRPSIALFLVACSSSPEAPPPIAPPPQAQVEPNFPPFESTLDAPVSYDAMIEQYGLRGAPPSRWREVLTPLFGRRIEWQMRSWGGEETSRENGYTMPDERYGAIRSRVRLVTPSVEGDLGAVDDAGIGVVACPTAYDDEDGVMMLLRTNGAPVPAPDDEEVILRGRFWGARGENGHPTVWLGDCEIAVR